MSPAREWSARTGLLAIFLLTILLPPVAAAGGDPPVAGDQAPPGSGGKLAGQLWKALAARDQALKEETMPRLFLPVYFRPPVPFLKMDDRFEAFVNTPEIRAEIENLEKLLLNPLGNLGRELNTGIRYETDAYGRQVRTMDLGGRWEFSTSTGPWGQPGSGQGYDYNSWLRGQGADEADD